MRIAIIGPESTGKSTLCEDLARHYKGEFIPEYARQYLKEMGIGYKQEDLTSIAKGQFESNKRTSRGKFIFCDTECITVKIWSEEKYGWTDPAIEELICNQIFDLYLLCKNDIDWSYDPLRETPDYELRESIYSQFKSELIERNFKFAEIEGKGEERLLNAIKIIQNFSLE